MGDGRYVFSAAQRQAYESLQAPIGIYQYVGGRVVTLLVSDGLCAFQGETRIELTEHFDNRMFEKVHPDDRQGLAQMAYQFAIQKGKYDIVYRSRLYGREEYRQVHAISRYHTMEDGSQIAFTHYIDITETVHNLIEVAQNAESPLVKFFNENSSAMVIINKENKHLLYYNKAVCRMLAPQIPFDSGMTFQQFFYPEMPEAMAGAFMNIDRGLHIVQEPRTKRNLEVLATSADWGADEACAVYFYEIRSSDDTAAHDIDLHRKSQAFQNTMFSGTGNRLHFWQDGYRACRVWNITKNILVLDKGSNFLKDRYGARLTYALYHRDVLQMVPRQEERHIIEVFALERLESLYETDAYPRSACLRLETSHGHVEMQTGFLLMRSPDTDELYLKVTEENISRQVMLDMLFRKAIEKEYDYVAYFDGKANVCRLISGSATSPDQWDRLISIEDYLLNFREQFGTNIHTAAEFIRFLHSRCQEHGEYVYTYELLNGRIKSAYIQMLDQENELFFAHRTDVTKLLQAEHARSQEMERLKNEAQAANQAKSMFFASINHDMRTPLNGVIGYTDLALEATEPEAVQNYLKKIRLSSNLLLSLVNDVLDFGKYLNNKIRLQPEAVRISALCSNVRTYIEPLAMQKELSFSLERLSPCEVPIEADPLRIQQILVNLLSNAVKFTPRGGWIKNLVIEKETENTVECTIIVQDNGIGMNKEFLPRIFEAYAQEERSEHSRSMGTGLGMAIVKQIVDLMQGSIQVESTINEGTTFTIQLQLQKYAGSMPVPSAKAGMPLDVLRGKRVLLCEDNELNAEIGQLLLRQWKMDADWAADGKQALELICKKDVPYDIILMDKRMPVMDGIKATLEIRRLNRADCRDVPILAMTGDVDEDSIQACLRAGMNAHIGKPINRNELARAMIELLQGDC